MKYVKSDLFPFIQEQLSVEYNCDPEDFQRRDTENILVLPGVHERRRRFSDSDTAYFFRMATMGANVVVSADRPLHSWLRGFIENKKGYSLFEYPNLIQLQRQLDRYEETLSATHHMYLPSQETDIPDLDIPVKWFDQNEIKPFYLDGRFPNALCDGYLPQRPDVLAVCAYDGDEIMGMAGCSADTKILWQIGIDVFPEYRGKGIGSYLVSLLKNEIINRGKIPYYGTSNANIYSQNIAANCGFYPAWVEIETVVVKR